ncbi:hypothetical protein J2Z17_004790 [Rhizobium halophytocola]|uniref:Uncharacterized protein n=1 Tax=Rhizobium halophytocola TaxID=735519 RepID=A0ABS4E5V7_9HYPH|nr:hypothetical protein [Rhizobium halophytocola]
MEMKFRKRRNAAQPVEVQIAIQMPIDVIQYPLHPVVENLALPLHHPSCVAPPNKAHARGTRSTDLAVLSGIRGKWCKETEGRLKAGPTEQKRELMTVKRTGSRQTICMPRIRMPNAPPTPTPAGKNLPTASGSAMSRLQ